MKHLLLIGALLLSATFTRNALAAIELDPEFKKLPVDVVITGLRQIGDSLRGPIEIHNTHQSTKIFLDHNVCSIDGICTEMAPFITDASVAYVGENADQLFYAVTAHSPQVFEELKNPILITFAKGSLEPQVRTILNTYVANSYVWMSKHDGSITCNESSGVSEFDMYEELKNANIFAQSFAKAVTGLMMPAVCGIPSGRLNTYLINLDDVDVVKTLGFDLFSEKYPSGQILK